MLISKKEGRELHYNTDRIYIGGKLFTLVDEGQEYECYFKGFIHQNISLGIRYGEFREEQEVYVQGFIKLQVASCIIRISMKAFEPNHCWIETDGEIMEVIN